MRNVFVMAAVLALLGSCVSAQANITVDTVPVGSPGNTALAGYGKVDYAYNIGKYEVTSEQYATFLNAVAATDRYGLYNTYMDVDVAVYHDGCNIKRTGTSGSYSYTVASEWANRPVNFVSWGDAARFANWLHNGQPIGLQNSSTTEDGAYALNGATTDAALQSVNRESDWNWAVTSEDEWHKAAYYKGGGTNAGYWMYPTKSNVTPNRLVLNPDPGNNANYNYSIGTTYRRTNIGEYENSGSAYGTFDQGGNVAEWNESILTGGYRGVRGGSYVFLYDELEASHRNSAKPTSEMAYVGFRVVRVVPEPTSIIALAGGLVGLLGIRRRRQIHNTLEEER